MTRPRIDPAAGAIVRALRAAAGGLVILEADSTPWASLTLAGARHRLALRCGDPAAAARIAARLPVHEFALEGHIVADVGEIGVEGDTLRFAALTVQD